MNSEDEIDNIDFSSTNDEFIAKCVDSISTDITNLVETKILESSVSDDNFNCMKNVLENGVKKRKIDSFGIDESIAETSSKVFVTEAFEGGCNFSIDEDDIDNFLLSSVVEIENSPIFDQFSDIEDQETKIFEENECFDGLSSAEKYKVTEKVVGDENIKEFLRNEENIRDLEKNENASTVTGNFFVSGFSTGNKNKIVISNIINKEPKISFSHGAGPIRSYNKPEKGHVSNQNEEKNRYLTLFKQIRSFFKDCSLQWLKIQYRWVWIHLYLNNQLKERGEINNVIREHIKIRKNNEYSILKRILEGDEIPYRYMILLVIDIDKNIFEVYDGAYSVKIEVDNIILRSVKENNISVGTRIRLFGCKYLLNENTNILDLSDQTVVLKAYYNGFGYCFADRKLGYKKKVSFRRDIMSIHKEGGPISCIVGIVKRIVEIKYVVQIKEYRNVVSDLQKELENIEMLIEKTSENVRKEDVKIKQYKRFVFTDKTGECLITSWMNINEINEGDRLMFCYLLPLVQYMGLHLTTTKYTFMKHM